MSERTDIRPPLAYLTFNAPAKAEYFGDAQFIQLDVRTGRAWVQPLDEHAPNSFPISRRRARPVGVELPRRRITERLMTALFKLGLTEASTFFRLEPSKDWPGWLELHHLTGRPRRQEPAIRFSDFLEPSKLKDFNMTRWRSMIAMARDRLSLDTRWAEFHDYVLSAHRMIQYHDADLIDREIDPTKMDRVLENARQIDRDFRSVVPELQGPNANILDDLDELVIMVLGDVSAYREVAQPEPEKGEAQAPFRHRSETSSDTTGSEGEPKPLHGHRRDEPEQIEPTPFVQEEIQEQTSPAESGEPSDVQPEQQTVPPEQAEQPAVEHYDDDELDEEGEPPGEDKPHD